MEQYHIHESDLVIEGKTWSAGFFAKMPHPDGRPYGTFRAYTLLVDGDGIRLTDCVLRGHQDTLFLAPLPEKEIIPGGFLGPKQFAPRKNHTVYFKNCLIEGGIDFIFGGATGKGMDRTGKGRTEKRTKKRNRRSCSSFCDLK